MTFCQYEYNILIKGKKMVKIKKLKLKNGATLYYAKNNITNISSVELRFNCGSQCDPKNKAGLAHFVEHMFFTGTDKLSKQEVWQKYFNFIRVNAYTNTRAVYFQGDVFNEELTNYLDMVTQMITHSTFTDEAIEKEKEVVKQEIVRSKDNFLRFANLNLDYNLFKKDFYKYSTLGLESTVDAITRKDVVNFVNKYFVSNNCKVLVCSPFSLGKIKKMFNNHLISHLPQNNKLEQIDLMETECDNKNFYTQKEVAIEKTYFDVCFTIKTNHLDYEFYTKLDLILDMLNGTQGISKIMRIERSLVYNCGFYYLITKNDCVIIFDTNMDKKNLRACQTTLAEYVTNVRKNGFSLDQFKQAKRLYDHNEKSREPRVNRLFNYMQDYIYEDRIIDPKVRKKIRDNFTLEEANKMVKEIFENAEIAMTTYGNADKTNALTKAKFKKLFE